MSLLNDQDQKTKLEKKYTVEEISNHNKKNDCWIIIGKKIYDVTHFLSDHPGGDNIIITYAGRNCTDVFEDIGHSHKATEMLNLYFVGSIE